MDEFWTDIQNAPMRVLEPMWCHPTSLPFSFSIFCAFYVDTADQPITHCGDFVTPVKGKRDEKQLWAISRRKSSEAQEGRRICSEWQSSTPRPRHINETVTLLKFVSNEPNEKSTAKFTKRTSLKWSWLAPMSLNIISWGASWLWQVVRCPGAGDPPPPFPRVCQSRWQRCICAARPGHDPVLTQRGRKI